MANPEARSLLQDITREFSIPVEVLHRDLGDSINKANRKQVSRKSFLARAIVPRGSLAEDSGFFDRYQPYSEIERRLESLAEDRSVKVETVGTSYENNKLYLVKVSQDFAANKPVIFIDAGHHAREVS